MLQKPENLSYLSKPIVTNDDLDEVLGRDLNNSIKRRWINKYGINGRYIHGIYNHFKIK
jgi:hypothetical protein